MSRIEKAFNKTRQELEKKREREEIPVIEGATNNNRNAPQNRTNGEPIQDPSRIKPHENTPDSKFSNRERNITFAVEKREKEISPDHESLTSHKKKGRDIGKGRKAGYVNEHIVSYYDFLGKQTWEGPVMVNYRRLQVSLKKMLKIDRSKVLVITSAVSNEGKSLTAVNIAILLCKNNSRVVLVDCDIRKPSVHKFLGFVPDKGISDYLGGGLEIENCSYNGILPGLTVIPAGSKSPNVCELLESEKNKQLLSHLRGHFDYVIIDTPPVLSFPDASVLSPLSDGVIMVVNGKVTKKNIAKRAVESLHDCRIIGCVMNESKMQEHSYYQYY